MDLKFKEEKVIIIDSNDLDEFISYHLKIKYDSIPVNEWSNDSCYEIIVSKDSYCEDEVNEAIYQEVLYNLDINTILNYLHLKGKVEAGKYIIKVCW